MPAQVQDRTVDQILKDIMGETETSRSALEQRSRRAGEITRQIETLTGDVDTALNVADERRKVALLKVLEAQLQDLHAEDDQNQQDIAQAIWGLDAQLSKLSSDYKSLNKWNAEEQAIADEAQQALDDAKQDLTKAQAAWFFRNRRVAKAQARTDKSDHDLQSAKNRAEAMRGQRLREATIDESLQQIRLQADQTVHIMVTMREVVRKRLDTVRVTKTKLLESKRQMAVDIKKLDGVIDQKRDELQQAQERLVALENGTPEYVAAEQKLSGLKADAEELNGARNAALAKYQSHENFAAQLEIHEQSQIKLRDNLLMWITSLKSDTDGRIVTFESWLDAMKASAVQEGAKNIDDVGAEIDQRGVESMAMIGAASDRARVEHFEDFPKRIKAIHAVSVAQVKAMLATDARMRQVYEDYKRRWGINPLETSFLQNGSDKPV